jgi:hypothetical protein
MSQYIEGPRKTFTAGEALPAFRRVLVFAVTGEHGPTVKLADATEPCIGVTEEYTASGAPVTIYLANAQGTRKMMATAAAITGNNAVYAANDGYVAATGTVVEGKALETTAGAAGDILEVLPINNVDLVAAAGITLPTVTFNGLTGVNEIRLPTNLVDALSIEDTGVGDIVSIATSTGSVLVTWTAANRFNGGVIVGTADVVFLDDIDLALGTGSDVLIRFSTADGSNHAAVIALDDTSQQIHITDKAAVATDWNRTAGTHPELSIHSNTTPATDYLAIGNHDGTDASVDVVGGTGFLVKIAGTTCGTFGAGGIATSALTLTGGIAGPTSTLAMMIPIGANAAAVTPAAAIPLTNYLSWLDATAGATTQTLAAGVVRGQVKRLQAVHGNNDVVTVTGGSGFSTITFTEVGEYVVLLWTGAAWVIIESGNVLLGTNAGPATA